MGGVEDMAIGNDRPDALAGVQPWAGGDEVNIVGIRHIVDIEIGT